MLRHLLAIAAIGIALAMSSNAAPITYQIIPRAGDAPGWGILGGEIVTDGTIGEIYPENFLSWEMKVSSPPGVTVLTTANSGVLLFETVFTVVDGSTPAASLIATTDELVMISQQLVISQLYFTTHNILTDDFPDQLVLFSAGGGSAVTWTGGANRGGGTLMDNRVDPSRRTPYYALGPGNPNRTSFVAQAGPLVIGSVVEVPEPSNLLIILMAGIASSLLLTVRK